MTAEAKRLEENANHQVFWKKWGPYLSERQWGTVREDYSPDGVFIRDEEGKGLSTAMQINTEAILTSGTRCFSMSTITVTPAKGLEQATRRDGMPLWRR